MKEMQRIVGDPSWIQIAQCKWGDFNSKIITQAQLEAPHKSRLREVLQEVGEKGKFLG